MKSESHPPRTYTSSFLQNGIWCRFQHQYRYARAFAHIRQYQQVADYAAMLNISRMTLNASVQAQYGQTAVHLLKQRLLAEIKNEILFTDKTTRI